MFGDLEEMFTEDPEKAHAVVEELSHNKLYCPKQVCWCADKCQQIEVLKALIKAKDPWNAELNLKTVESAKD